jgi:hypothetical protein
MSKKITMTARPQAQVADKWVEGRRTKTVDISTKRLTFDISEDLHRRLKVECAARGEQMTEFLRRIIERELGNA